MIITSRFWARRGMKEPALFDGHDPGDEDSRERGLHIDNLTCPNCDRAAMAKVRGRHE